MFKEELEQILTDHRIKWLNMLSELNDELISVPEMLDVKANIIEEALTSIINLVDKELEQLSDNLYDDGRITWGDPTKKSIEQWGKNHADLVIATRYVHQAIDDMRAIIRSNK